MRFDVHLHVPDSWAESEKIMTVLENLTKEVQETRDLTRSAITLLQGLKTKLDEAIANNDMTAVQALADELDANQTELADAISANTPADPDNPQPENPPTETPAP